jgi:hypothetical protein
MAYGVLATKLNLRSEAQELSVFLALPLKDILWKKHQ